ncbi:MAG TPA: YvrJ family protein [Pseudogracilibacillus sp.]|nr:YvrJ family protein [Pseudogracilibacillus sp.]
MEAWITFITELSFPIAITFYLLHRIEGKLDMLNNTLQLLPDKMK